MDCTGGRGWTALVDGGWTALVGGDRTAPVGGDWTALVGGGWTALIGLLSACVWLTRASGAGSTSSSVKGPFVLHS